MVIARRTAGRSIGALVPALVLGLVGCSEKAPPAPGETRARKTPPPTRPEGQAPETPPPARPEGRAREVPPPAPPGELAREILLATGVKGGLVVHVGCGDGRLTAALRANDRYLVHGLDASAANVEEARKHIRSLRLYGKVSVEQLAGDRLPHADNLVRLVVSGDLGAVPTAEVMRVLCPLGVAYVKTGGKWTKTVKPWPEEIDEWTHYLYDASNNAVAKDTVVGPPSRLQWVVKPLWLRSHETESGISALVSARGRIFYFLDEGLIGIVDERLPSTWSVVARDAFSGVELWRRPLPNWGWREWNRKGLEGKDWTRLRARRARYPAQIARRLVADGDRVFVTLGYAAPLSVLDAATGEVVRTCEGTEGTDEILCSEGVLVLCIRDVQSEEARRRGKTIAQRLVAIEADTGKVLWQQEATGIVPLDLAVEGGRVFYRGGGAIACLGLRTGDKLWRTEPGRAKGGRPSKKRRGGRGTFLAVGRAKARGVQQGVVLLSGSGKLKAFSAETGHSLWTADVGQDKGAASLDLFVAGGLVWPGIGGVGYDLQTGKKKRKVSIKNLRSVGHHHRCYRGKATERYIISAKEGVELLDIRSGETNSRNNWIRGSCKYGIMPSNGLLYVPSDQCFCEPGVKLRGFAALAAKREGRGTGPRGVATRLETGPAYGQIGAPEGAANPNDWPTYRHDPARSGHTRTSVPAEIVRSWQAEIGGKLSAPSAAGGRLFIASVDAHTVHALDAASGRTLWSRVAGGRVDSPPTVYKDAVLFGSADGWVYCLRASDGELAWRLRAAPEEVRVGAFGQLESAWPVHGSVLLQKGVAYVTAGRSSFLDGGIYVYGLDPATGKVLHEARVEGPYPDLTKGPGQCFWVRGARSEILVGDGRYVYMRQVKFDNKLARQDTPFVTKLGDQKVGLHLFSTASFLDDSWYNRTYWMYSERWPGFYLANQSPKSGQIVVFDEATTYAVKGFHRRNVHSPMFFPGKEGYLLFADDNSNEPVLVGRDGTPKPVKWLPQSEFLAGRGAMKLGARAVDYDKGVGFTRTRPAKWAVWVPVRIQAMVASGGTLFVAGPPDVLDRADPLAAFEGRKGGELWAVSAADGKKLAAHKLDSPPVLDGLIAAGGRLYLSTRDGKVTCLGGR